MARVIIGCKLFGFSGFPVSLIIGPTYQCIAEHVVSNAAFTCICRSCGECRRGCCRWVGVMGCRLGWSPCSRPKELEMSHAVQFSTMSGRKAMRRYEVTRSIPGARAGNSISRSEAISQILLDIGGSKAPANGTSFTSTVAFSRSRYWRQTFSILMLCYYPPHSNPVIPS